MRKAAMLCAFYLIGTICLQAKNPSYMEYIEKYYPIAVEEMQRTGIPASIKLAQGILESNAGRSFLAVEANNHFGIKCGSTWSGKKKFREDDDYDKKGRIRKSCFRAYEAPEMSFYAHSQFLKDPNKAYRYGFLFDLDSDDYIAWAKGLQRSGYATNPKYSKLLISLIEQYELFQYDTPVYEHLKPVADAASFTYQINGAEVADAISGDTPASIANRMDVKINHILRYNKELHHPGQNLEAGYTVYLQKKRNRYLGKKKMHIVRVGESVFDISQKYGILESKLRDRNNLDGFEQPKAGEYIFLQGKRSRSDKVKIDYSAKKSKPVKQEVEQEDQIIDGNQILAFADEEHLDFIITPKEDAELTEADNENNETQLNVNIYTQSADKEPKVATAISSPVVIQRERKRPTEGRSTHIVSKGETLYRISRMHDMNVQDLMEMNGLNNAMIFEGQALIVK